MAEGVGHAALEGWSEFCAVGLAARHEQTLFLPDMATHGGESVIKRRALLSIPGRCRHMPSLDRLKTSREQGHDGEQPKQARRGPGDG